MWRSIAARSRQFVPRHFGATGKPKVQTEPQALSNFFVRASAYRSSRFLSHTSANRSDENAVSSLGLGENGDSHMGGFDHGIENNGFGEQFSVGSGDNDETQMGNVGLGIGDQYLNGDGDANIGGTVVGDEENVSVGFGEDGNVQVDSFGTDDGRKETYDINVEKLENVLSLLQSTVDGSLEPSLDGLDLDIYEEFVVKVLETPLILGDVLIRFFKWSMKKPGFQVTTRIVDAFVRAVCSDLRKKDAYALWDLVREIGEKEKDILRAETLNELISLFSKLGKGKAALEVFNKFGDFGCTPNAATYYFTIEALCRRSFFDWAFPVCEKMLDAETLPDSNQLGKIISWFCKGGRAKDAYSVYLLAKEKSTYPPQSSVNFLIISLSQKDETVKLALEILDDFKGEGRKYAIKPFSAVISGLCRIKLVDEAKALLLKMVAEGPPPGNAAFNSIVTGYSKAGDMQKAKDMLKLMESRGLKPDVYTYTVIMSAYANGGQMDEACEMLAEAKRKHCKLSPVTYHTLIRGYCKLEEFDKALNLLNEMKDFGVKPNVDEYNKLIQSLCLKGLDWEASEKLLDEMKENGLYLNGITRGLIKAVKELTAEELEREAASIEA